MNEPNVELIALMAAALMDNQTRLGVRTSVRTAINLWDETIRQLEERKKERETKQEDPAGSISP